MFHLHVNGQPVAAEAGESLLDVLRRAGIDVPTLCHDDRLKPYGACRLCSVTVAGESRPVSSCSYPVREGLFVLTHTPELEQLRNTLLELMAQQYPQAAQKDDADKGIVRPFHQLLEQYGVTAGGELSGLPLFRDMEQHPYLQVDMSRCISCYRCVRICDEVQGQNVWQVWNRGERTLIHPDASALRDSPCVSCGACADTCPTGAIRDRSVAERGAPQQWVRTTCAYCGTGCELDVGTRDGQMVQIRPAMNAAVNHGHACVKGRYAWQYGEAADRITEPMLRDSQGAWRQVSWDEAYAFVAQRLESLKTRYGADAFGMLGSARATNEENYLAQKFARVVMQTNNVDCCARVCHGPSAVALGTMLGTGAATNHFDDIEKAGLILVCGCNPTENHPVVGARIRQAVRRGAQLIVIDPRRIELAEEATLHLPLKAGSNVVLFNAMAAVIVQEHLQSPEFVAGRVSNLHEFTTFILDYLPEKVADQCGVPAEKIRQAARLYARASSAMSVHGLGMTEHLQGSEGVMCLVNLALLTGNIGKPGAGVNPLRGQNNVQGSAHMGCEPSRLTGYVPLAQARERFEQVWQHAIPPEPGLNLMQMMDAAERGELKALWAFGYDIVLSLADRNRAERAMQNLELVVVQDMFMNETAREYAHVFLPAASNFEKEGTFMNADRRVQRVREVLPPRGNSRADWRIFCELAAVMGKSGQFAFDSAHAVWDEVRKVWLAGAGMSYLRLERESLHWPCPDEAHPGTTVLHAERFATSEKAELACIAYQPTPEQTDDEYPLRLVTGRALYHFNAGTMSYRTPNRVLVPDDVLEVSAPDAERLRLLEGQEVTVVSRYGTARLPWRVSGRVMPGELFTTFHQAERELNRVTSSVRDNRSGAPEYKVTAVRLSQEPV